MPFHDVGVREALQLCKTSEQGLSSAEASARQAQYGLNEIVRMQKTSMLRIFFAQFKNVLILLLLAAALISLFLGEIAETAAMLCIALFSAILGFFQEYRAEKAVEALEKLSSPKATVFRDGKPTIIPAKDLVPGDIILLEEGDIVPADVRLIEETHLQIDEASLTGESLPSEKMTGMLPLNTPIADQENMAFKGTTLTYGKGKAVVVATGMQTEFGKIATTLQESKETKTPLQKKFEQLSKELGMTAVILIIIIFGIGMLRGSMSTAQMLLVALSLAIAAVPSALPAIVTVSLSLGAKVLAQKKMIIKKLPAAESLGSITYICTDKTGTLTKNQMTVTRLFVQGETIAVSGSGYEPTGQLSIGGKQVDAKKIVKLALAGTCCNNARVVRGESQWELIGDPTEGSLLVLARKVNVAISETLSRIEEFPFNSTRKMMSVIYEDKRTGKREAYVKGAPDIILNKCTHVLMHGKIVPLTSRLKRVLLAKNEDFAGQALRVLALAYKPVKKGKYKVDLVEKDLICIGLVGMIDPPREEVKDAVQQCKQASIRVMVITGDHVVTAKAVAKQIGLFDEGDLAITGEQLDAMSEEELEDKIHDIRIVARAMPLQKLRIVTVLQKKGEIVAMTGDGVNDAPALKRADIGIAMGSGTTVAKEAAKATITDDNFATIVNGIAEGRNIYDKIIKSVRYLLSCNAGEILSVLLALALAFPLPMIPLQILLMNLITDGFPALGLSREESEQDIMMRTPRNPKEQPISGALLGLIVLFGMVMSIGTLYVFVKALPLGERYAHTMAFTMLVMFQLFAVLGNRSMKPFSKVNPFTNKWLFLGITASFCVQVLVMYIPFLQHIFGTTGLSLNDWLVITGIALFGLFIMELAKTVMSVHEKKPHSSHV
ncbi:MAG: cation-translocating P-type ATPase [archaeon]